MVLPEVNKRFRKLTKERKCLERSCNFVDIHTSPGGCYEQTITQGTAGFEKSIWKNVLVGEENATQDGSR
jgi:hypothetical protein